MFKITIRLKLDTLVKETESYDSNKTSYYLIENLKKWKWGSYGWVSPASLIFTATWRKYFYPEEDCCKIWAVDETKKAIPGGYSIRTEDETITIPVLAKYDLCTGYCSPNSGMQGSRAIEKMRSYKRLSKDFDVSQRTVFDLKLFSVILNQINELSREEALEVLKFQIVLAKIIQKERYGMNASLKVNTVSDFNLLNFLSKTSDPELTKCVVAACLQCIYEKHSLIVEGVSDYKTAADARAQKPGDLSLSQKGQVLMAIEVKDKTQTIDWQNISRANDIIANNRSLVNFIFVLEKRNSTVTNTIQEIINSDIDPKITIMSLHDLYLLALSISSESIIANNTGIYMSIAPAIKPETKKDWLKFNNK